MRSNLIPLLLTCLVICSFSKPGSAQNKTGGGLSMAAQVDDPGLLLLGGEGYGSFGNYLFGGKGMGIIANTSQNPQIKDYGYGGFLLGREFHSGPLNFQLMSTLALGRAKIANGDKIAFALIEPEAAFRLGSGDNMSIYFYASYRKTLIDQRSGSTDINLSGLNLGLKIIFN